MQAGAIDRSGMSEWTRWLDGMQSLNTCVHGAGNEIRTEYMPHTFNSLFVARFYLVSAFFTAVFLGCVRLRHIIVCVWECIGVALTRFVGFLMGFHWKCHVNVLVHCSAHTLMHNTHNWIFIVGCALVCVPWKWYHLCVLVLVLAFRGCCRRIIYTDYRYMRTICFQLFSKHCRRDLPWATAQNNMAVNGMCIRIERISWSKRNESYG